MLIVGGAALITGGRRIGAAVAKALAAAGMDVGLSYNRSRAEAEAAAVEIRETGRRAHIASANLGNPDDCRALVDGTAKAFGRLDVLVNMASVYVSTPFDESDEHSWGIDINNGGQVAGQLGGVEVSHAVVFQDGQIRDLHSLFGTSSSGAYASELCLRPRLTT